MASLVRLGLVSTNTVDTPAITLEVGDTLLVGPDAMIITENTGSPTIEAKGSNTLVINGTLYSAAGTAVTLGSGTTVRIASAASITARGDAFETVGGLRMVNAGEINASSHGLMAYGGNNYLTNAGTILGGSWAPINFAGGGNVIDNQGAIRGTSGAIYGAEGIYISAGVPQKGDQGNFITNSGTISGFKAEAIEIESGDDDPTSIVNSGTIERVGNTGMAILLGGSSDSIINHGRIIGNIAFDYGNDFLDNSHGVITGTVNGGNGDDRLIGSNIARDVLLGGSDADTLEGGGGNDLLDGGLGADVMIGGTGSDVYIVDNFGDVVDETDGSGTDRVESSVSFSLLDQNVAIGAIENLTLTGYGAIIGTGNALANRIIGSTVANTLQGYDGDDVISGGAGADKISGGRGNDTLAGNTGADTYYFTYALDEATNVDTIKNFSGIDLISLSLAVFSTAGSPGRLATAAFWADASGVAHDASDRIIYETDTGILRYDPDGTGAAAATAFAIIDNIRPMNAADFVIA